MCVHMCSAFDDILGLCMSTCHVCHLGLSVVAIVLLDLVSLAPVSCEITHMLVYHVIALWQGGGVQCGIRHWQ